MLFPKKLQKILDATRANYTLVSHRIVYTAFDLAATLRLPLADVVKTLLIKTDKGFAIALLSAAQQLDLKKLAKIASVKKIIIPKEREMVTRFKVKKGPLASFGSLYALPVYLDKNLLKRKKVLFSWGSFKESILLPIKDFVNAEQPIIGIFGVARKAKAKKKKSVHARRKG